MTNLITQQMVDLPRLRTPALLNAAEYWLAPERFTRRCEPLGDRFLVPMPASQPWLCLTHPDDIRRVFSADTDVLRRAAPRWQRTRRIRSSPGHRVDERRR